MNRVIEQLTQIEEAAGKIMGNTAEVKQSMLSDSEKRIKKYNDKMKRKTGEQIQELKAEYKEQLQRELKSIQEKGKREIEKLEQLYEENHHKLVQEIVDELTGV